MVNLTSNNSVLKTMARIRKEEYAQVFTEFRSCCKRAIYQKFNAIEGIVTSDERIAAIVNQNSAPLNHNEAEIAGYRDALSEFEYMTVQEAAKLWGLSERRVQKLCAENRIDGVVHLSRVWLIPKEAKKPVDARRKPEKLIKN